jgi:UDP-N-acetylmuramyl pentapeptide phosphotransferase/UDP-N-acetylglucosamine-1-phosphate transferase
MSSSLFALLIIPTAGAIVSYLSILMALKTPIAMHMLDRPNERSLHQNPTPRIGGLMMMLVFIAGQALIGQSIAFSEQALLVTTLALVLTIVSALDDRYSMAIAPRFSIHILCSLCVAYWIAPHSILLLLLIAVSIAWASNLFNFMDGSDGLAGLMICIGFSAFAIATVLNGSHWALSCLLAAGIAIGFLIHNWSPAKTFMGDAGSIPFGFIAASISWFGVHQQLWAWWFPLIVFLPFWLDATLTLFRRVLKREKFWQAHRTHLYQRLIQNGWSHARLAVTQGAAMIACALIALTTKASFASFGPLILSILTILFIIVALTTQRHSINVGKES